jgi:SSS family solute:Na+ symporter
VHPLDLAILATYLVGVVLLGASFTRTQRSVQDYFVGGRRLPWWAIMGSIVATETSTVTFISVPGYAYSTDFTFLQLVFGYLIGRVAVVVLFVPAYFRGELLTAYQLLGARFGSSVKRFASGLFLVTRSLADGFRLFATGLVLAAVVANVPALETAARAWSPAVDPATTLLVGSVVVIALATILYTYLGGMTAVVWTDVVQLGVYLAGAVVAAALLVDRIPGGWPDIWRIASAAGRFRVFDFTWDVTKSYTFWSGLIGGAFLTTATHGTDQMMVQRYLCAQRPSDARAALLWSGAVVFAQFALFLLIGAMLFVYYSVAAPGEAAAFVRDGRILSDRVFPHFVVTHLPPGLVGLVLAAIFAAAMSTLSSSLNSSAAAAVADFYMPATRGRRSPAHYLRVSRALTACWGLVQMTVAFVAVRVSTRVVDEVLGIASFTNGVILGLFLLGTLDRRAGPRAAFTGAVAGAAVLLGLRLASAVSWQWYVLVGALTTWAVGATAARLGGDGA